MNPSLQLTVIGAGIAGCEAAWQAAEAGIRVRLYEMKPRRFSPAHHSEKLSELVCSNSLRGAGMNNAVGLLKEELRRCGALFMSAADATAVPAGGALAVDRESFSEFITERIVSHPRIELLREEVTSLPEEGALIVASGPLTSDALSGDIARLTGAEHLYFYDSIAPIVYADSIDFSKAWKASRYGKGGDDYVNCPLSRDEYHAFIEDLRAAEKVQGREFEKIIHFEGCMPIEEMARRGEMTLAFGPMKPVGLPDPHNGCEPFAVVQLRQDDTHATLYNLVGFQTKLTWPEQRRIFRTIPGLENARFARMGSMHRNTFLNGPVCLERSLRFRKDPRFFFAGQITGVEGYVESAAAGFMAGVFAARQLKEEPIVLPPAATALGALLSHVSEANPEGFQPMNINYGLFPSLEGRRRKSERRLALAERALGEIQKWQEQMRSGGTA